METLSIVVIVVIVALFLGLMGFKLYSNIKLKGLRQTAIDLIVEAENVYEKGKNNEKFKLVFDGIIQFITSTSKNVFKRKYNKLLYTNSI